INLLEINNIESIVLGGFRRIFTPTFVDKYGNMTINTHPSILPAFPGDHAQKKAIEAGVKITGATIHFINNEVDQGPIINQDIVRINTNTQESELKEKIIKVEEKIIANAVSDFLNGYLVIEGHKVINLRGSNE
ncbi:phosphoribosylglycinamide formyltransferase, partial [Rodentibacter pneumotropicus]